MYDYVKNARWETAAQSEMPSCRAQTLAFAI